MNSFLKGLFAFGLLSSSVMAQPTDQDLLVNIGIRTNFTFNRAFNIPARPELANLGYKIIFETAARKPGTDRPHAYCSMVIHKAENFDREIPAGTEYLISGVSKCSNDHCIIITINSDTIRHLLCARSKRSENTEITIGEFREIFSKVFDVKLAAPVIVR